MRANTDILELKNYMGDLSHLGAIRSEWTIMRVSHKLIDWRLAVKCWDEAHLLEKLKWSRDDSEITTKPAKKLRSEYFDIADNQWKEGESD